MPTYQYACTACREELEAVQSFTDAPLTVMVFERAIVTPELLAHSSV